MPYLIVPFPEFDPVLVHIGPFAIRWYALGYIAGILLGWIYAKAILRSPRAWGGPAPISPDQFDDFVLWVTLGIILGGRVGYVLAVVLFARRRKIPILSLGDVTCAVAPIGIFLVRLANFINGELWGRTTDVPWAMVFPGAGPLPRHPSQIYEAILEGLVLFVVLALFVRFGALKRPGLILGAFALFYGLARSVSEFFREPDAQLGFLWGGLTMGILLSLPMILGGVLIIWLVLHAPARA